jgi:urate oxidase
MRALWQYNKRTRDEVEEIKARICVPSHYLSMCIRRGDKSKEFRFVEIERYRSAFESVQSAPDTKTVFLTTDDSRLVSQVREVFSEFDVVTLTEPETKGYIHSEFKTLPPWKRRYQTVRFLAQFEYLRDADLVLTSKTTNVSHITSVYRAGDGMLWVD